MYKKILTLMNLNKIEEVQPNQLLQIYSIYGLIGMKAEINFSNRLFKTKTNLSFLENCTIFIVKYLHMLNFLHLTNIIIIYFNNMFEIQNS